MTSSFTYTTGSTERKYYTDDVKIDLLIAGEQARLIDGTLDQDVREITFRVTVKQVWEQSGASDKRPVEMWLDMLGGEVITFKPDSSESASFIIYPDLSHIATAIALKKGTHTREVALRFLSKSSYQYNDSAMTSIAALMTHIGA